MENYEWVLLKIYNKMWTLKTGQKLTDFKARGSGGQQGWGPNTSLTSSQGRWPPAIK